jgi:hypothetical protein
VEIAPNEKLNSPYAIFKALTYTKTAFSGHVKQK